MSKRHTSDNNQSSHHKSLSHFFLAEEIFRRAAGNTHISNEVVLDDAAIVHQMLHVLRLAPGDCAKLLDGQGNMWKAKINLVGRNSITFELLEQLATANTKEQSRCQVVTLLPLLKGPRFEWALEKLTELNVAGIQPFTSTRTVVKVKEREDSDGRQKRWQNIIREAAEQSERLLLPELAAPLSLAAVLEQQAHISSKPALNLLLSERIEAPNIVQFLSSVVGNSSPLGNTDALRIVILSGPEGGFTAEEKELISAHGFQNISLGKTILRGETAAILAAGIAYAIASTLD